MGRCLQTLVVLLIPVSAPTPALALSDPNPFSNTNRLCKALVREGFKLGKLSGRVWAVNAGSSGFCDVSDLDLLYQPPGVTAISYIVQGTVDQPNEINLELNSYHRSILPPS